MAPSRAKAPLPSQISSARNGKETQSVGDCWGSPARSPCRKRRRRPRQCRNASPPRQPKPRLRQRNKIRGERKRGYKSPGRPVPNGLAGAEGRMARAACGKGACRGPRPAARPHLALTQGTASLTDTAGSPGRPPARRGGTKGQAQLSTPLSLPASARGVPVAAAAQGGLRSSATPRPGELGPQRRFSVPQGAECHGSQNPDAGRSGARTEVSPVPPITDRRRHGTTVVTLRPVPAAKMISGVHVRNVIPTGENWQGPPHFPPLSPPHFKSGSEDKTKTR